MSRKRKRLLSQHSNKPTTNLYLEMERGMAQAVNVSYALIDKFPKNEKRRVGLGNDIKEAVNEAMKQTIRLCAYNPALDPERERMLRELSVQLKFANTLIEIAFRQYYISAKQLTRWAKSVSGVDNKAIGLAMWYQQQAQRETKEKVKANEALSASQTKLNFKEETK